MVEQQNELTDLLREGKIDANERLHPNDPPMVAFLLIFRIGIIVAALGALFVVAEPWFVVGEEHPRGQLTTAADAGLLKDALEMLLDRLR